MRLENIYGRWNLRDVYYDRKFSCEYEKKLRDLLVRQYHEVDLFHDQDIYLKQLRVNRKRLKRTFINSRCIKNGNFVEIYLNDI